VTSAKVGNSNENAVRRATDILLQQTGSFSIPVRILQLIKLESRMIKGSVAAETYFSKEMPFPSKKKVET
jgi:hypothetical protein